MTIQTDIAHGWQIFEPQAHDYYGIFVKPRFEERAESLTVERRDDTMMIIKPNHYQQGVITYVDNVCW